VNYFEHSLGHIYPFDSDISRNITGADEGQSSLNCFVLIISFGTSERF